MENPMYYKLEKISMMAKDKQHSNIQDIYKDRHFRDQRNTWHITSKPEGICQLETRERTSMLLLFALQQD